MARRLSAIGRVLPSPRRRVQFAALVLAVIGMHSCVTRNIAERMENFATTARMPARIEVAYVRSLEPEAPPSVAPAPPPPPPPPRRAVRPKAPRAASAPAATAEAKAASAADAARIAAERAAAEAAAAEAIRAAEAATVPASAPEATVASASAPEPAASSAVAASASDVERMATTLATTRPASGVASGEPFDWPASTRVTFALTGNYRGEVTGNAQVEWIKVGSRYQVNLDFLVGPEFAPIIARRMRSEGDLTAEGLTPNRYDEDTQAIFRERRRVSVMFEPDAVVLANGDRRERLRGVQDTASQFVQMSFLFATRPDLLRVGGSVEVPLALPRNVDRWIYDV
ncbi:MAG: hypothetical protein ABIS28_20175, partial [Caldimonas sp.]